MLSRAKKLCAQGGCGAVVDAGERYCQRHTKAKRADDDRRRGSAHERGYTSAWSTARGHYLRAHPLCVECGAEGRVTAAAVVDHIKSHRLKEAIDSGDALQITEARRLFWDSKNWQSLCKHHHDVKTAKEDGGFGRRSKP